MQLESASSESIGIIIMQRRFREKYANYFLEILINKIDIDIDLM